MVSQSLGWGGGDGNALQAWEKGEGSQTSRNAEAVEFTPHFPSKEKEAPGKDKDSHRVGNEWGGEGTASSVPG